MHDSLITSWFQDNRTLADYTFQKVPEIKKVKDSICIKAPAKLNLFLKINKKYKDGYHNIETVYASITLFDYIILNKLKKGEHIFHCRLQEINNTSNIVIKVLDHLLDKYNMTKDGLGVYIDKGIPPGSGLGGESSDAVFTYLGFHKLFSIPFSVEEAKKDLLKFGTDIQFFLYGGIALGTGKPDKITHVEIDKYMKNNNLFYPQQHFNINSYILLIYPFISKNTKEMYKEFDKLAVPTPFFKNQIQIQNFLHNDFTKVLCTKYEKIKIILDIIKKMGYGEYCNISGSGSTVYIILKNYKEVMKVWQDINKESTTEISGACVKFTKTWKNIFN